MDGKINGQKDGQIDCNKKEDEDYFLRVSHSSEEEMPASVFAGEP